MVAAEHHGKGPTGVDVRDALADLIERLFNVAGDGKHIAEIAHGNGFAQIHAKLEAVGSIESRDLTNTLRAKPRTGPIGCAAIEWRSENGHVILAAFADVFDVGALANVLIPAKWGALPG